MDVIEMLGTWSRSPCDNGVLLTAHDRDAWIRIRPRMTGRLADLGAPRRATTEYLVSDHGEHIFIAATADRVIAVAGDDPWLCIDGHGDVHALVHAAIRQLPTGLGRDRQRRFLYDPPRGWLGLRRDTRAIWLHPAYPRNSARLTVFDARPFRSSVADKLDRLLFVRADDELAMPHDEEVETVHAREGLEGRMRVVRGSDRVRVVAAFHDDSHAYYALLEAPAEHIETFRVLIASFLPLPRTPSSAVAIWAA